MTPTETLLLVAIGTTFGFAGGLTFAGHQIARAIRRELRRGTISVEQASRLIDVKDRRP